ncbi:hypothetical protein HHK36_030604 [Tetracentron sinense]|uniref:RRM domain-containing protein n=1 Tax=Tetracentron sinense TaxID=13715 RepID=A0A835CYV8_TETSI|nr:hypothetical protein HHK36_030604 [Tetracentron sinense]
MFRKWRTENSIVKGWLINSMEPRLISNFIRFQTTKAVWDAISITYFDGTDTSQVYDLKREDSRQAVMMTGTDVVTGAIMATRGGTRPAGQFSGSNCADQQVARQASSLQLILDAQFVEPSSDLPLVDGSATLTDSSKNSYALFTSNQSDYHGWIVDSGATDHMTFDSNDFVSTTQLQRTNIANANGVTYPVIGAGTVALSPSLSLSNTLLVPSLSNKLMSVGQATEELNCCALIYPGFCFLQDILTKEMIGRGFDNQETSAEDNLETSTELVGETEQVEEAETETEEPSSHSIVPEDQSPENILEVSSPTTPLPVNVLDTSAGYELPFKHNRGKSPVRYSPDYEVKKSKYLIANHVSSQKLSEQLKENAEEEEDQSPLLLLMIHGHFSASLLGNIPYDATEEQLVQICEEVGPVVSFRLVIDRETGKPKGYGFCEYKDEETALSARRNLQGYAINGRQLRVDFAENDKGSDRNREQGRGGPGMTSNIEPQKQLGAPAILGDSALHQPIGLALATTAASVMAGALGGVQTDSKSSNQNGLQNQCTLGNDPLTHYLAKVSRNQLYKIMSELKEMATQNKELARQLLIASPQLPKAIFQAQIMLGMVTPQVVCLDFLYVFCYCLLVIGMLRLYDKISKCGYCLWTVQLQMPNIRQSPGSLSQPPLRDGSQGHHLAVPSHPGQPPLAQNNMQPGLIPRVQEGQVSGVPQNALVNNQPSALPHLPMQPQFQHQQLAQNQVILQTTMPGHSGLSTVPSMRPQPFTGLSVQAQTPTLATSTALKQQTQPPLLQNPRQFGAVNLGHHTQSTVPHATLQRSLLPRPLLSQPSFQPDSSILPGLLATVNKDAGRSVQVIDDAPWVPRSNTYLNLPSGLSEQTSMVGDTSEPLNRPSKLARLEDGNITSRVMMNLNTSSATGSGPTQVLGTGTNKIPKAEAQHSQKQVPQFQLPPDVETALLQQVMSLTSEQLSSLPPEQQQQVIQLQQMLR